MWVLPCEADESTIPFAASLIKTSTAHLHLEEGSAPTERYFISSHSPEEHSAQSLGAKIRSHWNIENGSHWQRDVNWREDEHTMRHHLRAHILSTLRQVALFLHRSSAPDARGKRRRISHQTQNATHQIPRAMALLQRPP